MFSGPMLFVYLAIAGCYLAAPPIVKATHAVEHAGAKVLHVLTFGKKFKPVDALYEDPRSQD